MQLAGAMKTGLADDGTWLMADGRFIGLLRWPDYVRRVGMQFPFGIGLTRLPETRGWLVLMQDDPDAPDLPPDTPNAGVPPPPFFGPAVVIEPAPIADPQVIPPGETEATVGIAATVTPPSSCEGVVCRDGEPLGDFVHLESDGDGNVLDAFHLGVAANLSIRLRATGRTETVDTNAFSVVEGT